MSTASINDLLADARRGLKRLTPLQAAAALQHRALLIDTRPIEQRRRDGDVPGAFVIDRNVLEWRLDSTSPDRIPELLDRNGSSLLIIMCNEGYSSSLAACGLPVLPNTGKVEV